MTSSKGGPQAAARSASEPGAAREEPPTSLAPEDLAAFLALIEDHFGLRLARNQTRALETAIVRLLARTDYATPHDLLVGLASGRRMDLLESLAADLTIGETHFFRVEPQIRALETVVLPDLLRARAAERRLRIWSAGCSTGEEPYTVAILLREMLPRAEDWDILLHATDISRPALEAARAGLYGKWSFRDTPDWVRERYFVPEGSRWRLSESVQRMVRFSHLNLADEGQAHAGPHGGTFDLILCRNVTIYFSPDAARRLYDRFARALAPNGWLMLGPSDPSPDQRDPFEVVLLGDAILWRPLSRPAPPPPLPPRERRPTPPALAPPPVQAEAGLPTLEQIRDLLQAGRRDEAREQAQRFVRLRPLEAEGHLLLGMLHLDAGAPEPALESLRRAAFLDAHNPMAHFTLGQAYVQLGDASRARSTLNHARRILATAEDQGTVPGSGISVAQLRAAVEAHLVRLT